MHTKPFLWPTLMASLALAGACSKSTVEDTAPATAADAIYTVTEVYPEHVVLDGNHPLAGIALRLDVTVRDVREAMGLGYN